MTPSGDFKSEYIIEQLSLVDAIAPILEPMVHHCTDLHLYDKCERALEFTKCFWKMSSSVVSIILVENLPFYHSTLPVFLGYIGGTSNDNRQVFQFSWLWP